MSHNEGGLSSRRRYRDICGAFVVAFVVSIASSGMVEAFRQPPPPKIGAITPVRASRTLNRLGEAAWVVSEVTVKKVVDTKELERIREVLKGVDPATYRLNIVQQEAGAAARRQSVGTLPVADAVPVSSTIKMPTTGNQAFVVSEVTVKKVVDTKELDRIRETLKTVDPSMLAVEAVRMERIR